MKLKAFNLVAEIIDGFYQVFLSQDLYSMPWSKSQVFFLYSIVISASANITQMLGSTNAAFEVEKSCSEFLNKLLWNLKNIRSRLSFKSSMEYPVL